jgi:NAD(P)-dependent dehydrogenase (short-subunit alcohol dehydrogenase family)
MSDGSSGATAAVVAGPSESGDVVWSPKPISSPNSKDRAIHASLGRHRRGRGSSGAGSGLTGNSAAGSITDHPRIDRREGPRRAEGPTGWRVAGEGEKNRGRAANHCHMKTVLITGCSSGIGRVTAELFARRGWRVAATARQPAALEGWARAEKVTALPLDVTDEASIAAAVATTVERFGTIDVLVNNAGYGLFGPLEGATTEQLEAAFRTNVLGVAAVIRQVLPVMRQRRGGTIVNVSSIGGRIAAPFASVYHATKFALEGLSESLRYELSLHGIRVKLVEPAHFKTGFIGRSLQRTAHSAYDKEFDNYMAWVHLEDEKAPGPGPVAEAVFRAATDSSARLRYPVHGSLILALSKILPDAFWRSLLGAGMTRRPKARVRSSAVDPREEVM